MMLLKSTALALVAAVSFAGSASAATILFDDDFERAASNTIGNGWTEVERNANDVRVVQNNSNTNGRVILRDRANRNNTAPDVDAGIASATIDATGFENISVTFRWRARGNNLVDDMLNLSFSELANPGLSTLDDWTTAFTADSSVLATNTTETVTLAGLSDTEFSLLFSTDVGGNNSSGFVLFEVSVMGDAITPVSLPAGLPLMLAGLGALGVAGRRKTKA